MSRDYSADVRRLYEQYRLSPQLPRETDAVKAGIIVQRLFPPADAHEALCVLAGLNLLNASVKQPWGFRVVTYQYIKGMASHLMIHILENHISDVSVYWDSNDRVAYFRTEGVQVSFHYIPVYRVLNRLLLDSSPEPQRWEGIELQRMSVALFHLVCGSMAAPFFDADEEKRVRRVMLSYRRPTAGELEVLPEQIVRPPKSDCFREDKWLSLRTALKFRIWGASAFTLWRRRDNKMVSIVRYTGNNYHTLLSLLVAPGDRIHRPSERKLERGKFYWVSPQKRIRAVPVSRYILRLTQNSYMFTADGYRNLCITYGIARYLSLLHGSLKFVCTMEYNRLLDRHHYYTADDLCRVPLTSELRWLKVWIVVDTAGLLEGFDPAMMPQWLIDDYMRAEDHYDDYQVFTAADGRQGLVGYRRIILLPPIYQSIHVRNFHARVKGDNGLLAVYSLLEERFRSDFVYENVWYDERKGAVVGRVNGVDRTIFCFQLDEA